MDKIVHSTTVDVELTLDQLADIIVGLGSNYQAHLISLMAKKASDFSVPSQLQYVTNDDALTDDGRHLMRLIGDYAFPLPAPQGGGGGGMSKPLRPAAQGGALILAYRKGGGAPHPLGIAATILALADQVVPEGSTCMIRMPETDVHGNDAGGMLLTAEPNAHIRSRILAIAAELEGQA